MSDELRYHAAAALVADGDVVNTLRDPLNGPLIAAPWSREDVLAAIERFGAVRSTEHKHFGLRVRDAVGLIYIATKED